MHESAHIQRGTHARLLVWSGEIAYLYGWLNRSVLTLSAAERADVGWGRGRRSASVGKATAGMAEKQTEKSRQNDRIIIGCATELTDPSPFARSKQQQQRRRGEGSWQESAS